MSAKNTLKFKRLSLIADPLVKETNFAISHCTHLRIANIWALPEICKSVQLPSPLESLYIKGIHGIEHAYRVLLLVQELADIENLNINQKNILEFCAIFHDIGRINDDIDDLHGKRSVKKIERHNYFGLIEYDNSIIRYIIENHCLDDNYAFQNTKSYNLSNLDVSIYLLKLFKDADNLDRYRLGDFDDSFLRIGSSFKLLRIAEKLNNRIYDINYITSYIECLITKCRKS